MLVDPFTEPKDATDEVKKMVKENQDALEKEVETAIKNAVVYLQDYMKVFAGEAEAKKITGVRYCYKNFAIGSLHNSRGLPVVPFEAIF